MQNNSISVGLYHPSAYSILTLVLKCTLGFAAFFLNATEVYHSIRVLKALCTSLLNSYTNFPLIPVL